MGQLNMVSTFSLLIGTVQILSSHRNLKKIAKISQVLISSGFYDTSIYILVVKYCI